MASDVCEVRAVPSMSTSKQHSREGCKVDSSDAASIIKVVSTFQLFIDSREWSWFGFIHDPFVKWLCR